MTRLGVGMSKARAEEELQEFYERWAPTLMAFERFYVGDAQVAETVTAQAFLKYFRQELPLRLDHIPLTLVSLALEESDHSGDGGGADVASDFEWSVLNLPPDERAVFVLHGVLDFQLPWVAAITRISFQIVNQLWVRALLDLRMATVHDDCSRLFTQCAQLPVAASELPA